MPRIDSFVFVALLAAMAAYWHSDLVQFVGSVVVGFTLLVTGICCISGPRAWLFQLVQSVAVWVADVEVTQVTPATHSTEATETEKSLRAQVRVLEQQLRSTEARVRDSERARETEKKRHGKEVLHLDAQLATVSRGIKESLLAKDRVIVECRQWRRKFEDLEHLQQQALETPVRETKERPRWAPAKKYGVGKRERGRSEKTFTAIAQVAIVNAAWESKLVSFEGEARDYVARTDDQIQSLHAAITALSNENAYLQQQMKATPAIPHELAQQQVSDAVASAMLFADQKHEEVVKLLKQTHSEELMAVKAGHEKESVKATSTVKAEAETARAQQREAVERAAQEGKRLEKELAAKEAQLGELQTANAKIAGDLRVKEEAYLQLESERDGFLAAGECLQARCDELETEADDFAREKQALVDEIEDLKDAAEYLADQGEQSEQQVEELKDNNRVLLEHNSELLCQTVVSDLDLQQTRCRVGNLKRQVADFEAADITTAVSVMEFSAE
ncbi:hypothetical protein N7537_001912 [Penicillium hordei]|uniref:Uncharacterized protein n=1 Tax=Penicillium hordei TaxID=40994 RepID=A0AAD6H7D1_9EURO|nr:uncharacterized protein N7537_001912 [Penicillium hordei]KAJ5616798.1 hypothetical protein N7537_001912 [Penicillium hordei]